MLKGAYFTNRNELIDWINSTLHIQMTKIEQLGSGNIYCHILDAAYPSKVPLQKVKWNAYLEIDFIYNFKILQNCFDHLGINKNIEVQKLVKAKYQDNLEFIQWMKYQFSEQIKNNRTYDPVERRKNAGVVILLNERMEKTKSSSNLLSCLNKENSNAENYPETARVSSKTPRSSLGATTYRLSLPEQTPKRRKPSFLQVVSKGENTLQKPRINRSSNRVHTQSGPLLLSKRLYTEFIMQMDEEQCF